MVDHLEDQNSSYDDRNDDRGDFDDGMLLLLLVVLNADPVCGCDDWW